MKKIHLISLILFSLLIPQLLLAKDTPKAHSKKAENSLPKQCLFYFNMFLHAEDSKAFAYAIDSKSKVTCRFSASSKNQKKANAVALASCQKSAKAKGIQSRCKIYNLSKYRVKTKKELTFKEKYLINLKNVQNEIFAPQKIVKKKQNISTLPKQCLMFYQLYKEAKKYKAFAIAIDNDEKYTCKFSASSSTMKKAKNVALASCEKMRIQRGIKNSCYIFKPDTIEKKENQKQPLKKKIIKQKKSEQHEPKKETSLSSSSALKKAILAANLKEIKKLIKHGADINTQAPDKSRALFVAVAQGDIKYAKELIKKGAFVFIKKRDGNNLLVAAIISGDNNMLKLMLKQKINPNIACEDGNTPLHFALMMFDHKMMKTLFSFGARDDIKNKKGKSVKELAKEFHIDLKRLKR